MTKHCPYSTKTRCSSDLTDLTLIRGKAGVSAKTINTNSLWYQALRIK